MDGNVCRKGELIRWKAIACDMQPGIFIFARGAIRVIKMGTEISSAQCSAAVVSLVMLSYHINIP